jgi:hypothetical protein
MTAWDVYENGRLADTFEYAEDMTANEVRRDLIDYDGFPRNIVVLEACSARLRRSKGRKHGAAGRSARRRS